MTSKPASRRARATIFAPRSWPSSPGLATTTRIVLIMIFPRQHLANAVADFRDLRAVARHELPVEPPAVIRPARDEVQVEVRHRLKGRGTVGLQDVEPI